MWKNRGSSCGRNAKRKTTVGVGSFSAFRGGGSRGSCRKPRRVSRRRTPRWLWEVPSSHFAKRNFLPPASQTFILHISSRSSAAFSRISRKKVITGSSGTFRYFAENLLRFCRGSLEIASEFSPDFAVVLAQLCRGLYRDLKSFLLEESSKIAREVVE